MLRIFGYNYTEKKSTKEIIKSISYLVEQTKQYEREEDIMLFVFVPTISLEQVNEAFDHHQVKISAQSFSIQNNPAIIGENTLEKLKTINTDMVLMGMADARFLGGESDELAAKKLGVALRDGYKTFLGLGESEELKGNNKAKEAIKKQLTLGCQNIPYEAHYRTGVIYRPLWAFGDEPKNTEDGYARDMLEFIHKTAAEALPGFPIELPVLYGGVAPAKELISMIKDEIVDGVFVDDAIYSEDEFLNIIHKTS